MSSRTERAGGDPRYVVRFGVSALILTAATLTLVLWVLPERYILSVGFAESSVTLPDATVPFAPQAPIRMAPAPTPPPPVAGPVPRGPAEIFWARVLPLLEQGRYGEALLEFERYLARYPGDDDVRRELARTLVAAGRAEDAIPVLEDLLARLRDPADRLALARLFRDLGRAEEASAHYAALDLSGPAGEDVRLEWALGLAWLELYDEAAEVLRDGLETSPWSARLRLELARVRYYGGRVAEAGAILEAMTDAELAEVGGLTLRADVRAALFVPEAVPTDPVAAPEPTLLERAVAAREADDFDAAAALFSRLIAEDPENADAWMAYANFLEYELRDLHGARAALLEAERLGAADDRLDFRIALLDAWTGRSDSATARLEALLERLGDPADPSPGDDAAGRYVTPAEVLALMGDLERWNGDRVAARERYETALAEDPANRRALDGIEAVRTEVDLLVEDIEAPRVGVHAYALGDTDDFGRFDLAGDWTAVRGAWVWGGSLGRRWLSGSRLGAAGDHLQGTFVEAHPARWWRSGTVRTSARLGAQWLREGAADYTVGASVQYRAVDGGSVAIEYAHEPAYPLTVTLQSLDAQVSQDRLIASVTRPLSERWSVSAQGDLARLDAGAVAGEDAQQSAAASTRVQGSVSVTRTLTGGVSLGWSAVALGYSDPAPAPDGLRLFWDPATAVSAGPVLRFQDAFAEGWEAAVRLNPGLAIIDERAASGFEGVPQLSADARLQYLGPRLRLAMDLFYAQARVEGYRTYGFRLTVNAPVGLPGGSGR